MPSTTYTLIEGPPFGFDIEAEIEYVVHPACGDGWNEPREPACAEIRKVDLTKVTRKGRFEFDQALGRHVFIVTETIRTPLPGPTPDWVDDALEQAEWWDAIELDEREDA